MKLTEFLVKREQELLDEITDLQTVADALLEAEEELASVREAMGSKPVDTGASVPDTAEPKPDIDVSDLIQQRSEFEKKFGSKII